VSEIPRRDGRTGGHWARAGDVRLPRRPVVEGLVGPQGVVGAAERAEFDSECVAIADDRAVELSDSAVRPCPSSMAACVMDAA
jgi:hypothetical protein